MLVYFLVGIGTQAVAQTIDPVETEQLDFATTDTGQYTLTVAGAGDVLSEVQDFASTSSFRGQFALLFATPWKGVFSFRVNTTDPAGENVRSSDLATFGSAIATPSLGPWSFSLIFRMPRKFGALGPYGYAQFSSSTWELIEEERDSDSVDTVAVSQAIPYATGAGVEFTWTSPKKTLPDNQFFFTLGLGAALRGVGGDVTQNGRLTTFIGSNGDVYGAPEARVGLGLNAARINVSALYFAEDDIDGLSGFRAVIELGVVGKAFTISWDGD